MSQAWTNLTGVGDYFDPPITVITDRQLMAENNKLKSQKDLQNTFRHIHLVLVQVFEDALRRDVVFPIYSDCIPVASEVCREAPLVISPASLLLRGAVIGGSNLARPILLLTWPVHWLELCLTDL